MSELKLENVELFSDVMGDDELVIRKGNATYIPSTPEFVEIARRCNIHSALTEHLRLKEEECKQLQQDKAELVDRLKELTEDVLSGSGALPLSVVRAKELLEKHKCD